MRTVYVQMRWCFSGLYKLRAARLPGLERAAAYHKMRVLFSLLSLLIMCVISTFWVLDGPEGSFRCETTLSPSEAFSRSCI